MLKKKLFLKEIKYLQIEAIDKMIPINKSAVAATWAPVDPILSLYFVFFTTFNFG